MYLIGICMLLLLNALYVSVRSNQLIVLFKSSISLLIFCLDALSLIQGEASILILNWMTNTRNFTLLGSELCCIPLYSVGLCSGAQLNYLG